MKRRRRWPRALLAIALAFVVYVVFTAAQVFAADDWDHTQPADAAVVLGAAQYNGRPSGAFRGRLDRAQRLYQQGVVPQIVLTGAGQQGDRFTEAYAGLKYLRKQGIPERDLIVVSTGTSTWESLAASFRVLRRRGIDRVLLVSDPYHSYRLEATAHEVGFDGSVSPTARVSSTGELFRESMLVAAGRIVGYRRLVHLLDS
ncbi:MAG: YdcF family protein [Acidimicrobiales bacterium]